MKKSAAAAAAAASLRILVALFGLGILLPALPQAALAADDTMKLELDSTKATPRAVEPLTDRGIRRDYRLAWNNLAQALRLNAPAPLEDSFSGEARQWLRQSVLDQTQSHLTRRYSRQSHHLEAVFYSPEGDVMELHDTAQFNLQILDGDRVIDERQMTVRYVVLMTPGADRWLVRHLQAVPQF